MKQILTILILVFLSSRLFAQSDLNIIEQQVSLNYETVTVEAILNSISQQTGAIFSYNSKRIDTKRVYSINVSRVSIREALFIIFEKSVLVKNKGKYIILIKQDIDNDKSGKEKIIVEGYITNPDSSQKLQNVTIYDKDQMVSTVTDKYGYFKLEMSPAKPITQLRVCKAGYSDTVISPIQIKTGFVKIDLPEKHQNKQFARVLSDSLKTKIPKWLLSQKQKINSINISGNIFKKAQVSFLPFISSNQMLGGSAVNDYSFNILGGYVKGVRKLELAGIFNIDRGDVQYCQMAGISNIVTGNVNGFQGAGIINFSNNVNGVQCAGYINLASGSVRSCQMAGIGNFCGDSIRGVQVAGILSVSKKITGSQINGILSAGKTIDGSQISGIISVADTVSGTQISGITNFARSISGAQISGINNICGEVDGIQISSILNFSYDTVTSQISGILNIAQASNGFQIALINIADTSSGIPIGLFSFIKKGYHKFEISFDELRFVNFSYRLGVPHFYNVFSAGIQVSNFNKILWNYKFGLGTLLKINERTAQNIEISSTNLMQNNSFATISSLYYGIDRKLNKNVSLDFGLTYNLLDLNTSETNNYGAFKNIAPYNISTLKSNENNRVHTWIGARIGLRF